MAETPHRNGTQKWIGIGTLAVMAIAGLCSIFYWAVSASIDAKISPLQSQLTGMSIENATLKAEASEIEPLKDKVSKLEADGAYYNSQIGSLITISDKQSGKVESNNIQIATIDAKLVEVETQFRSDDQSHNIQWANVLRYISLLWKKAYGTDFPSAIQYYPEIAR